MGTSLGNAQGQNSLIIRWGSFVPGGELLDGRKEIINVHQTKGCTTGTSGIQVERNTAYLYLCTF